MKKVISILLVLVAAVGFAFAATAELELTTSVTGTYAGKIVSGITSDWSTSSISTDVVNFTTAQNYSLLVQTNQTSVTATLVAGPLENQVNSGNYIEYSIGVNGGATTTVGKTATTDLSLINVAAGSRTTEGLGVESGYFSVLGTETMGTVDTANHVFGYTQAPQGAYKATITVTYTAS